MHGLVSLLDQKHYRLVESLWQLLEVKCGLVGVNVTPFPHFSWLVASDFDWLALETTLQEITSQVKPFTAHTTGLGYFSGPSPVIFIPVIRTAELSALHRDIWENIQPFGIDISPLYAPEKWVPHITLAITDVTQSNIACAMQNLAFQTYNWEIHINNISFIHEPDTHIGQVRYNFELKGGSR